MYEDKKDEYFEIDNRIRSLKRKLNILMKNINVLENTDVDKLVNELEEKQEKLNEINSILNSNILEKIDEHFECKLKCILKIKNAIINNTLSKVSFNSLREELNLIKKTDDELFLLNKLTYFSNTNDILNIEIDNIIKECEEYFSKSNKENFTPINNFMYDNTRDNTEKFNLNNSSSNDFENTFNIADDAFINKTIKDIDSNISKRITKNQFDIKRYTEQFKNLHIHNLEKYLELNSDYKKILLKFVYSSDTLVGYVFYNVEERKIFYISTTYIYKAKLNQFFEDANIKPHYVSGRRFKDNRTKIVDVEKVQLNEFYPNMTLKILKSDILYYDDCEDSIRYTLFARCC